MNIPNLDVNNGKDKDEKQFIAPRSPRMVDIYFPDGGEFGTLNVDCNTMICLMHPYKKYVNISFTEIKNPNNNLWYSDKVHITSNRYYHNHNKKKHLRNINITDNSNKQEKTNNSNANSIQPFVPPVSIKDQIVSELKKYIDVQINNLKQTMSQSTSTSNTITDLTTTVNELKASVGTVGDKSLQEQIGDTTGKDPLQTQVNTINATIGKEDESDGLRKRIKGLETLAKNYPLLLGKCDAKWDYTQECTSYTYSNLKCTCCTGLNTTINNISPKTMFSTLKCGACNNCFASQNITLTSYLYPDTNCNIYSPSEDEQYAHTVNLLCSICKTHAGYLYINETHDRINSSQNGIYSLTNTIGENHYCKNPFCETNVFYNKVYVPNIGNSIRTTLNNNCKYNFIKPKLDEINNKLDEWNKLAFEQINKIALAMGCMDRTKIETFMIGVAKLEQNTYNRQVYGFMDVFANADGKNITEFMEVIKKMDKEKIEAFMNGIAKLYQTIYCYQMDCFMSNIVCAGKDNITAFMDGINNMNTDQIETFMKGIAKLKYDTLSSNYQIEYFMDKLMNADEENITAFMTGIKGMDTDQIEVFMDGVSNLKQYDQELRT